MSSPESDIERRERVQAALKAFTDTPMAKAATQLLNTLGYASGKTADLGDNAEALLSSIEQFKPELGPIDRKKVQAERWKDANWQSIKEQREEHGVAFFFKQWGGWGADGKKRSKKDNGRVLAGKTWNQMPASI